MTVTSSAPRNGNRMYWALLQSNPALVLRMQTNLGTDNPRVLAQALQLASLLEIAPTAITPHMIGPLLQGTAKLFMEIAPGQVGEVKQLPPLDPNNPGYVITVLSLPYQPTQIALRPAFGATMGGAQVQFAAEQRKFPHTPMLPLFFPFEGEYVAGQGRPDTKTFVDELGKTHTWWAALAGAYLQYNDDRSVTLTTKSSYHNRSVERLGTVRFDRKADADDSTRPILDHANGAAVRELASLIANATGLTVRLGDAGQAWSWQMIEPSK